MDRGQLSMMSHRLVRAAIVALSGSFVFAGCSEDEDNVPRRPQIVPHINPVNFCQIEMPAPGTHCVVGDPEQDCAVGQCSGATNTCIPRKVTFDLMLFNRGRERLDISSFEVESDRRCAFVEPSGSVKLYDNDESDAFAATARHREAAFMRIEYSPPIDAEGMDEAVVRVHSNAENFAEPGGLEVFVCAGGTYNTQINCRIRMDPECSDAAANAFPCDPVAETDSANPCPSYCSLSGTECTPPTPEDPMANTCPEGEFCRSPYYCVPDEDDPLQGTCYCRPCAVAPEEGWDDCPAAG